MSKDRIIKKSEKLFIDIYIKEGHKLKRNTLDRIVKILSEIDELKKDLNQPPLPK